MSNLVILIVITFCITFCITFLIEKIIRKKFHIEKSEDIFFYQPINAHQKLVEIIIVVLSLLVLFFIAFILPMPIKPHYFIVGIIVLNIFRFYTEWKYRKEMKQYMITLLWTFTLCVFYIGFELIIK